MTTPERLRRRQRIEAAFVALLAFALAGSWWYFRDRTDEVVTCVVQYAENQSETNLKRSQIVESESETTRQIIRRAFRAESERESFAAFEKWNERVKRIDRRRDRNPVVVFDLEKCTAR